MNLGEGSPSFIVALGPTLDRFVLRKCSYRRCKTCPTFSKSKTLTSNVTDKTYKVITQPVMTSAVTLRILYTSFLAPSVTFNTSVRQHLRMNQHSTCKCGCEHVIHHSTEFCQGHQFQYQIIEKLPGTGYINGELDKNMTKIRKEHEDAWIKKVRIS